MKLMLYDVDFNNEVPWLDGEVWGLECSSQTYFACLIRQIKGYDQGHVAIVNEENELDWVKDAVTFMDYYALDGIEKTVFAKYGKLLDATCRGEEWTPLLDNAEQVILALLRQIDDDDLQWDYRVPRTISSYLKFGNAHVVNASWSVAENMQNVCTLIAASRGYAVCVLVNAKSFFTIDELNEILKSCVYHGLRVLLIDNIRTDYLLFNEKKIAIDEDFYDIMITV